MCHIADNMMMYPSRHVSITSKLVFFLVHCNLPQRARLVGHPLTPTVSYIPTLRVYLPPMIWPELSKMHKQIIVPSCGLSAEGGEGERAARTNLSNAVTTLAAAGNIRKRNDALRASWYLVLDGGGG